LYLSGAEKQRRGRVLQNLRVFSGSHIVEGKILLLKYSGAKPGFSEEPEFTSRSFTQQKVAEPNKNLYQHQWLAGESKPLT